MKKHISLAICGLLAAGIYHNAAAESEDEKNIYIIPMDAKCVVRKADKITYCTEKRTGEPITGELRRYFNNALKSRYPLTDGVLEGIAYSYYPNGQIRSEKPYTAGMINGTVKEYDKKGMLLSITPYENGIKEGVAQYYNPDGSLVAQAIYEDGKTNGEMRVYAEGNQVLYEFINQNGAFSSGTYHYLGANNQPAAIEIPPLVIAAFNNKCLEMQTELTDSPCAAVFDANSADSMCNKDWRRANRTAVRHYLSSCQNSEEEADE